MQTSLKEEEKAKQQYRKGKGLNKTPPSTPGLERGAVAEEPVLAPLGRRLLRAGNKIPWRRWSRRQRQNAKPISRGGEEGEVGGEGG